MNSSFFKGPEAGDNELSAVQDDLAFSDAIIETLRDPLLVLDADLRVVRANEAFFETFAVNKDETRDIKIYELGNGQWDIPVLRHFLENVLEKSRSFRDYE